jgi:DNA-binding LytR/AlgR family response regulator
MRVLIADDEPVARDILREYVESIEGLELVGEAATGTEALAKMLTLEPDLALLDLEMPELNGLSVMRSLRPQISPLVIFITAYPQHALSAFEVGAVDYLLKPVRRERLFKAVEKARTQWKGDSTGAPASSRKIVGRRGSDLYLLNPEEIIAFQAEGELVHVISAKDRYFSDHSLKELESKLPKPRFRRIHRRTIINTDHIRRISPLSSKRWLLIMSNGFEAVVSKRLATTIKDQTNW